MIILNGQSLAPFSYTSPQICTSKSRLWCGISLKIDLRFYIRLNLVMPYLSSVLQLLSKIVKFWLTQPLSISPAQLLFRATQSRARCTARSGAIRESHVINFRFQLRGETCTVQSVHVYSGNTPHSGQLPYNGQHEKYQLVRPYISSSRIPANVRSTRAKRLSLIEAQPKWAGPQ